MNTAQDKRSHDEILQQVCDRRAPAEIEVEYADDDRQFGRMRLMGCDEEYIYIDRPRYLDMPLELAPDTSVTIHFMFDGERYAFRSTIETERLMSIEAHQVSTFAIPWPQHVQRQERRHDYRVSLGRCAEVRARFRPEQGDGTSTFIARLMNVSAGGMAVIAVDLESEVLQMRKAYHVEFELPGVTRTFSFKTLLCHVRPLQGAGFIIGFKFLPESNAAETRYAIRRLSQFVSKQVRRFPDPRRTDLTR